MTSNAPQPNVGGENTEEQNLHDILSALNLEGNDVEENLVKTFLFLSRHPDIVVLSYEFRFKLKRSNCLPQGQSDEYVIKHNILNEDVVGLFDEDVKTDYGHSTDTSQESQANVGENPCLIDISDVNESLETDCDLLGDKGFIQDVQQPNALSVSENKKVIVPSKSIKGGTDRSLKPETECGRDRKDRDVLSTKPSPPAFIEEHHKSVELGSEVEDRQDTSEDNSQNVSEVRTQNLHIKSECGREHSVSPEEKSPPRKFAYVSGAHVENRMSPAIEKGQSRSESRILILEKDRGLSTKVGCHRKAMSEKQNNVVGQEKIESMGTEVFSMGPQNCEGNVDNDLNSVSSASPSLFGIHSVLTEKGGKSLKCQACDQTFDKPLSLAVHEIYHSPGIGTKVEEILCPICDFKISSKRKVKEHLSQNHGIDTFLQCPPCRLIFVSLESLENHKMSQKHMDTIANIDCHLCYICGYTGKTASGLRAHMVVHLDRKEFACSQCSYRCKTPYSLKKHENLHNPSKEFLCTFCPYITHTKDLLKRHIKQMHSGENKYKCRECDASFREVYRLKAHAKEEHDSKDLYFCTYCLFSCKDQKHYRNHIQIHRGKNRFSCDKCDYTANQQSKFKRHLLSHTNSFPVKCTVCGHGFKNKNAVDKHMAVHRTEKAFACHICPFRAKSKRLVQEHLRVHSKTKDYKCDVCDYATKYQSNLVKHHYIHSDLKRYECILCPYKSKYPETLRRHLKLVHKTTEKVSVSKNLSRSEVVKKE